ncbi:MAG: cysteine desulfurase family protein [Lachnospiraceae bacterium]
MNDNDEIYADNAATTRMSERALRVFEETARGAWGNPSSLHRTGQNAAMVLDSARRAVASALGASPAEILFTSGGSESDNQALLTGAMAGKAAGKTHIISTAVEHHAVLNTLDRLESMGFSVTRLAPEPDGTITPAAVEEAIRPETALVSVMAANNEIGTIEPVAEIGRICRRAGVLFHTDAVQAAGHLPLDTEAMNIDLLSLSGHKFHGPKGTGALYVRRGTEAFSLILGGGQERGHRAGTENVPGIASMAEALKECCENMDRDMAAVTELRDRLIRRLLRIPHTRLNGSAEHRLPGNVNITFEGVQGESLLLLLDERGIAASAGSACSAGSVDPSHVLKAIGLSDSLAASTLRFSLDTGNTAEEADRIADAAEEAVARLRSFSPVWKEMESGARPHEI